MKTMKMVSVFLAVVAFGLGGCSSAEETADDDTSEGADAVSAAEESARVELFQGLDKQYYFHVIAESGGILLQSEGYSTAASARNGIASVMKNGATIRGYEIRETRNGEAYFVIKAKNGEIVGVSKTYEDKGYAEWGARTMRELVPVLAASAPREPKAGARFEVLGIGPGGRHENFFFQLRAKNGEVVLSSNMYWRAVDVNPDIRSVRTAGVDKAKFEIVEAPDGKAYFRLNGKDRLLAWSEIYASKANAERGRDAVIALLESGTVR